MELLTIGYEGLEIDRFVNALVRNRVTRLLDVRELPLSRKRGFSKGALGKVLKHSKIEYQHVRPLGCPKRIRNRYRADGDWWKYVRDFRRYLRGQDAVLVQVARLMSGDRIALLCYEADFNRCHRSIVGRALVSLTGAALSHITKKGIVADSRVAA